MGAYLKEYLEDSNDLMRLIFEEVAKNKKYNFEIFVEGFMNSMYRELMDNGSTRVINMTYDELLEYLNVNYHEIFKKGKFDIDYLQAGWIGMTYNKLQYILKIPSKDIYQKIPLEKMMKYFKTLHQVDDSVAVDKIINADFTL